MFKFLKKRAIPEESKDILISVLEDAKKLLSLPENDYSYSPWEDAGAVIKEIDGICRVAFKSGKACAAKSGQLKDLAMKQDDWFGFWVRGLLEVIDIAIRA